MCTTLLSFKASHLHGAPPQIIQSTMTACLRACRSQLLVFGSPASQSLGPPPLPFLSPPTRQASSLVLGVRSRKPLLTRAEQITPTTRESRELKEGIAGFYDESSSLWENIWGDHMHHGFYDPDSSVSLPDHRAAQIRMIDEALRFAGVSDNPTKRPKSVVDVGCGVGGSSRYLARKFGAKCQGITLSPVQARRANALAAAQGLADKVSFQVADALEQPFPDGQFDLVWSMESGEHMPDKSKFVSELARVAAPGGTIIIVTWCHRDLDPSEESLQPWEEELLNRIRNAYYLPAWCSTADYVKLLQSLSLEDIKAEDWSRYVAPFWPAVIRSALTWKGLTSLLRTGRLSSPCWIKNHKRSISNAIDDGRIQEGSYCICYHYLSEASVSDGGSNEEGSTSMNYSLHTNLQLFQENKGRVRETVPSASIDSLPVAVSLHAQ